MEFFHQRYCTPLHKLFYVSWHRQFIWVDGAAPGEGVFEKEQLLDCSETELEEQMDRETDAVLKERVATSTRTGYASRNVSFMIWLFDSNAKYHDLLLEPDIIPTCVFTCMFADFISRDCPPTFTQDHINMCRKRMALSILNDCAVL